MSGTAAIGALNTIYNKTFLQYLKYSETIGGPIYQQSQAVNNIFNTNFELIRNFCRFRKPSSPLIQHYLIEPLHREIDEVVAFETRATENIFQVTFISKSVKLFEWVGETEVEKFVAKLHKYVLFYRQKAEKEIEDLGRIHFEWLKYWLEVYDELSVFIVNFFPHGVVWLGNEELPLTHVLGDSPVTNKIKDHQALLQTINTREPNSETSTMDKVFTKIDNKWMIQNQKNCHNLVLTTARKDETVHLDHCEDSTIVVETPVDTIQLETSKKVTLLYKKTSRVLLAHCQKCCIHCFEKVGTVEMLECVDCGLYLPDKSLDTPVTTKLCTGVHINFPFEDGLYHSFTISDQLITRIAENKGLESTICNG